MAELEETDHESFRLPTNKDIPIWRYMDLGKYLAMLDRRSLYFARATHLGDPFEGSTPAQMVAEREYVRANKNTDPKLAPYKDTPDAALNWAHIPKQLVASYLVSCWHMNEHDSAAMWKLYSSSSEAVSIRSTYRRLRQSVPKNVMIGEVNYINYQTQRFSPSNGMNFIMHKRMSFSHERELRAILWEMAGDAQAYKSRIDSSGTAIEVDLSALIERVYVSPTAPPWFSDLVVAMTKRCGYDFPVSQSVLADAPLY
jgi:hypothetical protein